jgi:hypothetical protein
MLIIASAVFLRAERLGIPIKNEVPACASLAADCTCAMVCVHLLTFFFIADSWCCRIQEREFERCPARRDRVPPSYHTRAADTGGADDR